MTIIQLRVLLALKELGNFTEAGERLGITQSAVSHAVAAFEKEIGITVFHRNRSGVVLTEGGHRILDHVREIVGRVNRIKEDASSLSGLKIGKITVGTLQSAALRIIPGVVGVMRQKFPGIEISVFEGTDKEVHEWILSETVDLGILTAPCQDLETYPLLRDRMFGIVPEHHPSAGQKSLTLDQLAAGPIIQCVGTCGTMAASRLSEAGLSPAHKTIEARNIGTMSAMVRSGVGAAILAGLALPRDLSGIHAIPIDPPQFRQIVLAAPKFQFLSPAAKVFVDFTKDWIAGRFQELI